MIKTLIILCMSYTVSCYKQIIPIKISFNDNLNHLDKKNLDYLEKIFYLKNKRY